LEKFGLNKIVWIPSSLPEEFTGGHIDGMARFIDKETVVVPKFTDQSLPGASVFEDAAAAIREAGLTVVRMDMPGTINYDPNQPGESAIDMEAVYVNWLVGNGFVLATGFGVQQWDESAKRAIEGYFPERDVHMISTPTIWYYGGGVHCVTNDQPGKGIIH
jgi:agmatine deiminase